MGRWDGETSVDTRRWCGRKHKEGCGNGQWKWIVRGRGGGLRGFWNKCLPAHGSSIIKGKGEWFVEEAPLFKLPFFPSALLSYSFPPDILPSLQKKKKRTILSRFLSLLLLYNLVCWWYTLISFHITSCSGCFWVGQWIYSIFRAGRFFFGRRSLEHGMEEPVVVNREDNLVDLPPGFRFHPTDEEIITHYLAAKAADGSFTASAIGEVDLNKCEPWDMPSMLSLSLSL